MAQVSFAQNPDAELSSDARSLSDSLFNAASSTEEIPQDIDKSNDPVINMEEANVEEQEQDPQSTSPEEQSTAASAAASPDWHEFTSFGKKKRFDLNNKEEIKKLIPLVDAATKWRSERDSFKTKYGELEAKYSPLQENWDKIERAFKTYGVDGVIDMLGGEEGYSKKYWDGKYQERLSYEKAPEHERVLLDAKRQMEEMDRKQKAWESELKSREEKLNNQRAQEQETQLIADLRPHFNKYSFTGRLGDADAEKEYNDMLWDKTIARLEERLATDGVLPNHVIAAEFKATHDKYAKVLKLNKAEVEQKVVQNLKTDAKKQLASAVRSHGADSAIPPSAAGKSSSYNLSSSLQRLLNVK